MLLNSLDYQHWVIICLCCLIGIQIGRGASFWKW